jgi:hypothetical protein
MVEPGAWIQNSYRGPEPGQPTELPVIVTGAPTGADEAGPALMVAARQTAKWLESALQSSGAPPP